MLRDINIIIRKANDAKELIMREDYIKVVDFCKKNWQSDVENTLKIANLALENKFLFNSPWDMERTVSVVDFGDQIDWWRIMNGDNEFLFQLNRHRFLISLGQAYQLTNDEKYAECLKRILNDWITRVKLEPNGNNPWRSLEVGIRGEYWVQAMDYVKDSTAITEEIRNLYLASLITHADVLRKMHQGFHKGSNWGIIQDCGLLCIGVELNNDEYIELALTRLIEEVQLQVMADGVHWEQSCTYHNEILLRLLNIMRLLKASNRNIPEKLLQTVNKMMDVNIAWIKPDGRQPLFGDSDNNLLYDLFAQASLVLNREDLKSYAGEALDYESAWLFGGEGIEKFENMNARPIEFKNAFLEDSGNYVLRHADKEKVNYLCMHNGYTGGGHAHADKLHIDLSIANEDVLVDAGRYTYVNNGIRKKFKSSEAHNTTTVGNKSFLNMRGWGYWDSALSVQYPVHQSDECVLIGGAHLGYQSLFAGVYAEREVLFIKPNIYILIDGFRASFPHSYQQYFHFNPDGKVSISGNEVLYIGKKATAKVCMLTPGLRLKNISSEISPHYNYKIKNSAVKTTFRGLANRFGLTVIYGDSNENFSEYNIERVPAVFALRNVTLPSKFAEGIVIKTLNGEYTICIAHKEIKSPFICNEKVATGRIKVYKDNELIFTRW